MSCLDFCLRKFRQELTISTGAVPEQYDMICPLYRFWWGPATRINGESAVKICHCPAAVKQVLTLYCTQGQSFVVKQHSGFNLDGIVPLSQNARRC